MNKVLIVDDDLSFCVYMKTLIDWEENDFCICDVATDGQNAIKLLETKRPNIVITDINMPVMDGITLIAFIEQNYTSIKTIALSAYDNFEYVRQSLKKGAVDYILKNVLDRKVLLDILSTARQDIIKDKYLKDKNLFPQKLGNMETYLQMFLNEVFNGFVADKDEIGRGIAFVGFDVYEWSRFVVALAEIDDFWVIMEKMQLNEVKIVINTFLETTRYVLVHPQKVLVSHIQEGKFFILFGFDSVSEKEVISNLDSMIKLVKKYISMQMNMTVSFGISDIFSNICSIGNNYSDAQNRLKTKFFKGKDNVIKDGTGVIQEEVFSSLDIKDEKQLLTYMRNMEKENTIEYVEKIFNRMFEAGVGYKSAHMVCIDLINIINKVGKESGIQMSQIYSGSNIPYEKLKKYETLNDVKAWIIDAYIKLMTILESISLKKDCKEYTRKAIEYIHNNYYKDISLNDIAQYVSINSEYLSRIFKEDIEKGLTEYLNSVRIEHAKLLIQNGGIRLKDIVAEVGFNNYNYFFKVFKNIVNMTPQEYEKTIRI